MGKDVKNMTGIKDMLLGLWVGGGVFKNRGFEQG